MSTEFVWHTMEVSWTVAAVLAGRGWSQTPRCCRFPVDTCQDWFLPPPFVWMLATGDPGHWSRRNTACHSPGHVTTSRWRQVAAGAGPGLPQSRHHPSPTGFIIKYHLIFNAASKSLSNSFCCMFLLSESSVFWTTSAKKACLSRIFSLLVILDLLVAFITSVTSSTTLLS